MRMLDICSGEFGWAKAFLARGWKVDAIDILRKPSIPEGIRFFQDDLLHWSAGLLRHYEYDFVCASTPCEQFSVHGMKHFHPNPKYPEMGIKLFNHTRAICEESGVPHVIENVRAAQQFVGKAVHHCGPFYLWGTGVPAILPQGINKGMSMSRKWCQELGGYGSKKRNEQTAAFATVPPELANCVAEYAERLMEVRA